MEVLIPMEMAKIIDVGIMQGNLSYIVRRGLILVIMAMLALYFGIIAGKMADHWAADHFFLFSRCKNPGTDFLCSFLLPETTYARQRKSAYNSGYPESDND